MKEKENKKQFITIDMETWNRFAKAIFDINKEINDNIIINYEHIEKILKDNRLRFHGKIVEEEQGYEETDQ